MSRQKRKRKGCIISAISCCRRGKRCQGGRKNIIDIEDDDDMDIENT